MRNAFIAAGLAALVSSSALALPPPGYDPNSATAKWFKAQTDVSGMSCCGLGNGHRLKDNEWRIAKDGKHYEVHIEGEWRLVPDRAVRESQDGPNPTGGAVVWTEGGSTESALGTQISVDIICFRHGFME